MVRRLFIHVGTHKTGTTSIQAFLAKSRQSLERQGVAVYSEDKEGAQTNAWALAHCFIRPELQTPMRLRGAVQGKAAITQRLERFRNWCFSQTAPTCVVSSEAFCFLRTDQEFDDLSQILGGLFEQVVPVLTVRSDKEWRKSWDHQLRAMAVLDRIAALPDNARVDGQWYFNVNGLRSFWARFGQVVELDYEAALRDHGSIIPPFCSSIEVIGEELDYDIFLNVSPHEATGRG